MTRNAVHRGRRSATHRALAAAAVLLAGLVGEVGARQAEDEVTRSIRGRIEALRATGRAAAGAEPLLATTALPAFYERRGFGPAWVAPATGTERLERLLEAVGSATRHGLDPEDYDRGVLLDLAARARAGTASTTELVDLELLASDAFLVLGSHLLHGRVNPETVNPEWLANRRSTAMEDVLEGALASGRIAEALEALAPQQARYQRMVEAGTRIRAAAERGGWGRIAPGPSLRQGDVGPRVRALRRRLAATADLPSAEPADAELFTEDVERAVRHFQSRHGLDADGVVGAVTLAALDVSAGERLRQIEINLERWRWLPADLGARHIEVNIASFTAAIVERSEVVRTHRAVVGRRYRQTPMFSGLISYIVLAPYWHVPPNIAVLDKLPGIRVDPGVLARERMKLIEIATNREVDPTRVDWSTVGDDAFNRLYRLRQDPGPSNALGGVKFMFPNRHHVYLHDTPSRELFDRTSRSFSSGCIRVEHALDLAEYLLADQPEWTRSRIESAVTAGREQAVQLRERVPVHLLYWTAWADEDGVIHFREDIYARDAAVLRALAAPPPGP